MHLTALPRSALSAAFIFAVAALLASCGGGGSGDSPPPSDSPGGAATLTWDAADPSLVVGYRVYFGTAPRAYGQPLGYGVNVGNTTTYTVTGLTGAQTYYFTVTSVDAQGGESAYSNEASKLVQ